jgi:hypothetical protein
MALGGLAVALTIARAAGLPVDALIWVAGRDQWFQPVTSLFVHPGGSGGLTQVLIDCVLLYLILPAVRGELEDRSIAALLVAGAAGGVLLGLGAEHVVGVGGARAGWGSLLWALFLSLGLRGPERVFRLFWVLPVTGRALVWGSLGLAILFCVAEFSLGSAASLGTWLGATAWWHGPGPGGRRRSLRRQAKSIERELRVIQGGRNAGEEVH